mgnify:CR=1 FL=1
MQETELHSSRNTRRFSRSWSIILLTIILLVGAYLRFTGLNWDEGEWIHPDEGHMRTITSAIHMPDRLSLYFDTHNSPLNCRNTGRQYSYGTLPLFLTRWAGERLDGICAQQLPQNDSDLNAPSISWLVGSGLGCGSGSFTGTRSAQVGRVLSALADLGTVFLVYLIGRRLYGETAGLLAAGLSAMTAFSIQQAHFFTVDSTACFFTTLTAYFAVRASQTGSWMSFGAAGLTTGLAAACKVSAALAALLVALAAVQRWAQSPSRSSTGFLSLFLRLTFAGLLSLVAFRIAQPYAFEGPGFFGLHPSPEWFGRLSQIRAEQSGELDFPSGRQWTNRTPILFPWKDMLFWGMGLPLGLAAWIGWAVAGVELLRGRHKHIILWGWASLIFFYQATRWVKTMRYFLSLYPIFVILAAYLLIRLTSDAGHRTLNIGRWTLTICLIGTFFWALAFFSIYLRPHPRVAASRWIYANIPEGSTLANEHWDWGLPLRIDGHDPFGGVYNGLEMQHYNEDTLDKRRQLFGWLDQADYVILASNRLYASISRLPARYPLTTEYYQALFAGELGFELTAKFTSYPTVGPFQFPDQENPYPLMDPENSRGLDLIEIPLPPAEEAFSVYDHPNVFIFRKTDAYSRQLVEEALSDIDVEHALHGLTPIQATGAPDDLLTRVQNLREELGPIDLEQAIEIIQKSPRLLEFDPQTWAEQRAGGAWSEMFDRHSLLNRRPALAALAWWGVVTILGWLAFPLLFAALPRLRDRGYGLARMLALLLIAYLTWMAASLRILPNTRGAILRMTLFLALVGGGVGWLKWDELRRFLRSRWRMLLLIEALFALLYAAWVGVRLLHPDLWHPVMGGEKPMDFAYLNAVMKSTWFPPYNPWFSGSLINYYYFGFVIVGSLIKLMGTVPALAYNLAVPLLFALTGVGAFSVAYDLFGGRKRGRLIAGVTALSFTILLGNLGVVHLIRSALVDLGGVSFPSTIPGFPEAVGLLKGLWKAIVHGASLPVRVESWYWHPTRIIPTPSGEVGPITEFPAFTFLYGDLHAHMIALPLVLLALALAVYWARTSRPGWPSLALGGLVIGALWPTNTWDYPTYLALGLTALALGVWKQRSEGAGSASRFTFCALCFVWRAIILVGLTGLLYLPYHLHYVAGYSSIEIWHGSHTPLNIYLWIHAGLLLPLLTRMLIVGYRNMRNLVTGGLSILALFLLALILVALDYTVALATLPVGACAAYLVWVSKTPPARRLLWFMVGTAMALSLAVEIVVLKGDIGRMNTVFKFYLQVWILLSITAAVSLAWMYERTRSQWTEGQLEFAEVRDRLWWGLMAILTFGGALFLPFSIHARAVDRISPQTGLTLDGMAFMEQAAVFDGPAGAQQEISLEGDYAAIRWMQDNIIGSPVILEGLGRREYLWANRVSVYTGLPTVVGWRWHQEQQRAFLPNQMVERRRAEVAECYSTTNAARARDILSSYDVRYIYVGAYERAYYTSAGLAKFDEMVALGWLRVVYEAQEVTIYEVID